jgi:hypothetical protein
MSKAYYSLTTIGLDMIKMSSSTLPQLNGVALPLEKLYHKPMQLQVGFQYRRMENQLQYWGCKCDPRIWRNKILKATVLAFYHVRLCGVRPGRGCTSHMILITVGQLKWVGFFGGVINFCFERFRRVDTSSSLARCCSTIILYLTLKVRPRFDSRMSLLLSAQAFPIYVFRQVSAVSLFSGRWLLSYFSLTMLPKISQNKESCSHLQLPMSSHASCIAISDLTLVALDSSKIEREFVHNNLNMHRSSIVLHCLILIWSELCESLAGTPLVCNDTTLLGQLWLAGQDTCTSPNMFQI